MFVYKPDKPKVLLVDNQVQNLIMIKEILEPLNLDFYIAKSGIEALDRVSQTDFDMILLETQMDDIDGYEICRRIRSVSSENDLAILFISDLQNHEDKAKGFESGADDYLVLPVERRELVNRLSGLLYKRRAFMDGLKKGLARTIQM